VGSRGARLVVWIAALAACQTDLVVGQPDVVLESDGGIEAGPDAGPDAGSDGGPDAGPDAGPDGGPDAGYCVWNGSVFRNGVSYPPNGSLCCNTAASAADGWVQRLQPTQYKVGQTPAGVAVGDFNGDGKTDLAVITRTLSHQLVLLQNNGAAYEDAGAYVVTPSGTGQTNYPCHVATADLNGDGKSDVVVTNCDDNSYEVFLSQPNGLFVGTTYPLAGDPIWVEIKDVDGDGYLDLVVALYSAYEVAVLKGSAGGGFGPPVTFAVGTQPDALFVGNLDSAGVPDLALTNQGEDTIWAMEGLPDGGFARTWKDREVPNTLFSWITGGDLDGDGTVDLAATGYGNSTVPLLLGQGDGTFQTRQVIQLPGSGPNAAAIADIDGDGKNELIVSEQNANLVEVLRWNLATSSVDHWFSSAETTFPQAIIAVPHPGSAAVDLALINADPSSGDAMTVMVNGCP
jgi:hypothetical protein